MSYTVVSTFHRQGYNQYGSRMIDTFLQNWPKEIELWVYAENCQVAQQAPNLKVFDLNQASPELCEFKRTWQNVPKATGWCADSTQKHNDKTQKVGFKWDAVRFSHKVYSIFAAARNCNTDWLLWMDADMICHSTMPVPFLDQMCPADRDICFLGRRGKYTECGLYALNLRSQRTQDFLNKFQHYYDNAEQGIFTLSEWHDSFVFDAVRQTLPLQNLDWSSHIVSGEGHPLINSPWGAYLDHLKGDRKQLGRSKAKDLKVARQESYWQ